MNKTTMKSETAGFTAFTPAWRSYLPRNGFSDPVSGLRGTPKEAAAFSRSRTRSAEIAVTAPHTGAHPLSDACQHVGYELPHFCAIVVPQLGEGLGAFTGFRRRRFAVFFQMCTHKDLQLLVRHVYHGISPFFCLMPQHDAQSLSQRLIRFNNAITFS